MQLGFTHRPLEPEQQAIIEVGWVVEPVFIQNERLAQGADLQQAMPVARVTGESRDLQPHDHADAAETDVGDDPLKPGPLGCRRARQTEVVVDDHDLVGRPAQRQGSPLQRVLPGGAFLVLAHLLQGRLPHVEAGETTEMVRRDRGGLAHVETPSGTHLNTRLARTRASSDRTRGASSRSPLPAIGRSTAGGRLMVDMASSHAGIPRVISSATPYPRPENATCVAASSRTTSYCRRT